MQVKIKKLHKDAVIPKYETSGAVGMDLTAVSKSYDEFGNVVYGTGLAVEIPAGYYADLRPRSSISKYDLVLANSVGTIDSDYRGELILKFKGVVNIYESELCENGQFPCVSETADLYKIGDRIGQIVILPYPKAEFIEVDDLSDTERGTGGFGSSGQ